MQSIAILPADKTTKESNQLLLDASCHFYMAEYSISQYSGSLFSYNLICTIVFLMHKYSNVQNKQPMSHSVILVHLAEGQPIKKGEGQVVLAGSMMSVTLPPAETASDNKYLAAATHRLTCLCGGWDKSLSPFDSQCQHWTIKVVFFVLFLFFPHTTFTLIKMQSVWLIVVTCAITQYDHWVFRPFISCWNCHKVAEILNFYVRAYSIQGQALAIIFCRDWIDLIIYLTNKFMNGYIKFHGSVADLKNFQKGRAVVA